MNASPYIAVALLVALGCGRIDYVSVATVRDGGAEDRGQPPTDGGEDVDGSGQLIDAGSLDAGSPEAGAPDAGTCSETPCRLVLPQCGCPPGDMCTRPTASSPMRGCRPIGATPVGGACTLSVECTIGTGCVRAGGAGICALWCASDAACPMDSFCARFSTADPDVGACTWLCDPRTSAGCPAGQACYAGYGERIGTAELTGMTFCAGPGTAPIGEACSLPWACAPGGICAGGTCLPVCAVGDACAVGSCAPLSPDIVVGGVSYGACV